MKSKYVLKLVSGVATTSERTFRSSFSLMEIQDVDAGDIHQKICNRRTFVSGIFFLLIFLVTSIIIIFINGGMLQTVNNQ